MIWSFLSERDTIRINLTPAPTVVFPLAVVPSKKSARTPSTVLIKSMYFCDRGKLLVKALTAQLIHNLVQFDRVSNADIHILFEQPVPLPQQLGRFELFFFVRRLLITFW